MELKKRDNPNIRDPTHTNSDLGLSRGSYPALFCRLASEGLVVWFYRGVPCLLRTGAEQPPFGKI